MSPVTSRFRSAIILVSIFVTVMGIHFVYLGLFPEKDPAQDRWAIVVPVDKPSWISTYLDSQSYWLGYSYALVLTFSIVALRRYRQSKACSARNFAIGGFTLTGLLAIAGCFLVGCCGSPMLIIYLNLFGAAFLPIAKPFMAGITTLTIFLAWWWMNRKQPAIVLSRVNMNSSQGAGKPAFELPVIGGC